MARQAPKGRNIPAQGNALGSIVKNIQRPEGARQRLCRPFRACWNNDAIPGRCPGLACSAPLALKSGGGEDVDHLAFGGDGLAHELADGGVDLLGRLAVGAALLVQRGLQGLEPSRLGGGETDCRRQPAGRTRREAAGESTNSRRRGSPWLHRWRRRGRAERSETDCRQAARRVSAGALINARESSITTCTQRFLPSSYSRMCSCPAGMSARRSVGLPVVHLFQLKPCIRSQAMPCFSSITAMACAVSKVGFPWPPLSV